MEGSNCNGKGGWMRMGYLNISEPGATCPPGLTQQQYNNIDHDVYAHPNPGALPIHSSLLKESITVSCVVN